MQKERAEKRGKSSTNVWHCRAAACQHCNSFQGTCRKGRCQRGAAAGNSTAGRRNGLQEQESQAGGCGENLYAGNCDILSIYWKRTVVLLESVRADPVLSGTDRTYRHSGSGERYCGAKLSGAAAGTGRTGGRRDRHGQFLKSLSKYVGGNWNSLGSAGRVWRTVSSGLRDLRRLLRHVYHGGLPAANGTSGYCLCGFCQCHQQYHWPLLWLLPCHAGS